ncbi:MAG TPA: hypothetical protein VKF84_00550 [Candidatus Sulfotelmatobacter sp.]|nr:hypothetical protein [Candidatus Sulfotelmatobacter sp.]
MRNLAVFLILILVIGALFFLTSRKPAGPTTSLVTSPGAAASSSPASPDAVQQKLQEYSGAGATDCGRLNVGATADQSKSASDCAMQASQSKHPFYVAYDMPGMSVGVAGNAAGKLYSVQSQGAGAAAALTSGDCPSQLRVASSGRVTCFAPGDMGGMGGGHAAMPQGMANPHATGTTNPHAASKTN